PKLFNSFHIVFPQNSINATHLFMRSPVPGGVYPAFKAEATPRSLLTASMLFFPQNSINATHLFMRSPVPGGVYPAFKAGTTSTTKLAS
ncbi:MAG: hypothetical protein R3345_06140, partial [Fulvivirga sp.]|nr:hypothetical protein [Fulvivirga sp.]